MNSKTNSIDSISSHPDMPSNLPLLILSALESIGERAAFTYLDELEGRSWSGHEASSIIRSGALGLHSLGVKQEDCVGIMLRPSPPWILAEQMILSLGAVSVGVFDNLSASGLEHYIHETNLAVLFVDQEENIAKIRALPKIPQTIIVSDRLYRILEKQGELEEAGNNKKLAGTSVQTLISWSQLLRLGDALDPNSNAKQTAHETLSAIKGDALAAIIYTSGSTGLPKGVMLSHKAFLYQTQVVAERYPLIPEEDRSLSILPIAHIFERTVMYFYISRKITIFQLSDPKKLRDYIGEAAPTIMTAVPRLLERVHEGMLARAAEQPFPRRNLAQAALRHAVHCDPQSPPTFMHRLYDRLVYKKLRAALGGSLKFIISGGAALDTNTLRFFCSIGIPTYEGYGLSETAPVIACSNAAHFKPNSVGRPLTGITVTLSKEDELLVSTPAIMQGYWKNPDKTKEVLRQDETGQIWFHTGDKARLEDGFIFIEGRIKEFFKTSTGKYVNPEHLEAMLTKHPLVGHAMVIGEFRKYASALLFVPEIHKSTQAQIEATVQAWVDKVNTLNESWEHIQKFVIIWKELSVEENELTPKMNIKRKELETKYKASIEANYPS